MVRYPAMDADIGLVEYYFVGAPKDVQPKISKGRPFVPTLPSVKKGMLTKITENPQKGPKTIFAEAAEDLENLPGPSVPRDTQQVS